MWFLLKSRGWGENEQNSDGGQYNTNSITFKNNGGQQTAHLGLRRLKYNMFSCNASIVTVSSASACTTQETKSLSEWQRHDFMYSVLLSSEFDQAWNGKHILAELP